MQGRSKPFHVFRWDQKELKEEKLILGSELPPASYYTSPPLEPPPYLVLIPKSLSRALQRGCVAPRDSWGGIAKDRKELESPPRFEA